MKIAIVGGIASGKSTIMQMLRERGISTFSADAVARDVLWDNSVQEQLMSHFSTTESISPVILKSLISQDDSNRRAVNRIMHPVIAGEIEQSLATVYEIPILFETCLQTSFDAIWLAKCSPETQNLRLRERYGDAPKYDQISWQLDSKVANAFADSVINTDASKDETLENLLQEGKRWGISLVVS